MPILPWWPRTSTREFAGAVIEAARTTRAGWKPEPVITILPDPAEGPVEVALVPEIEVRNTRVSEILRVAKGSSEFGGLFESIPPTFSLFTEVAGSTSNRSISCTYAHMAGVAGRPVVLDAVVSKFAAFEGGKSPYDAFATLVAENNLGTELTSPITGNTLHEIVRGEAVIVMTLDPDEEGDAQTVLVVGARQRVGQDLELLIANSYSPFPVAGKTQEVNPNLVWAKASDVAMQAEASDPSVKTVMVFSLNKTS